VLKVPVLTMYHSVTLWTHLHLQKNNVNKSDLISHVFKARHSFYIRFHISTRSSVLVICITDISRYTAGSFLLLTDVVFIGCLLSNLEITPIVVNIARFITIIIKCFC